MGSSWQNFNKLQHLSSKTVGSSGTENPPPFPALAAGGAGHLQASAASAEPHRPPHRLETVPSYNAKGVPTARSALPPRTFYILKF